MLQMMRSISCVNSSDALKTDRIDACKAARTQCMGVGSAVPLQECSARTWLYGGRFAACMQGLA